MAVNISIISACNNNCDYCFQRNSYHNSGDMLSYEEIENILKWSKGAPIVRVLGGEATLHPDIIKINQRISEEFELGFFTNLLCDTKKLKELLKINYAFWLVNTTTRDELVDLFDENMKLLNKVSILPVGLGATLTSDLEQDEKYIRRLCKIAKQYPRITKNLRIALATPCHDQEYKLVNFDKSIELFYEISKKEVPLTSISFDCAVNGCGISYECFNKVIQDYRTSNITYECPAEFTIDIMADKSINFCGSVPEEIIPIKRYDYFPSWVEAGNYLNSIKYEITQRFHKICWEDKICSSPICQGVCFAAAANLLKQSGKHPELFKFTKD